MYVFLSLYIYGRQLVKRLTMRCRREGSQIDSIASCPRGQEGKFMGGRDERITHSGGVHKPMRD